MKICNTINLLYVNEMSFTEILTHLDTNRTDYCFLNNDVRYVGIKTCRSFNKAHWIHLQNIIYVTILLENN